MKIFLYVPLIICLVGCSKDSKTSDKGGAAKDQKVKTEPLPDFPDPMTKEFIMAMWEAPHNVEGIIPEMEQVLLKEGVWKVERKIGPNKNELEDVPAASMTLKFTKRRFHIWKFSFEDFVQFSLMTFDYEKESYRWWYLMPDDFIGENSGNIAEGENFIWESVVMPEENGEGVKMKSVEDLSLRKTNEDPVTIEIQMLRKDEIIWVAEDTLTWASELPKEGDFESNIAGKAISIEVKEGTKKNRMLFDFGEDRVLRLYEDGELVDESMSYRVDGLEVKFLAREQEDVQALDRLAMRMLFSSEDPKLGDEIIMKDRNNSFAGKIVKFDELAKVLKENLLEQMVSYGRLKETFDGKYLYKGKPFTGKVHGGTGGGNRFEGNIVKGKWEGIWTEWDKDGNKIQEDLYKNGELVSSDKLEGKSKDNSLRRNLVGKYIIFEKDKEKIELGFLKNGEMLSGPNDNLDSGVMTYSIKNNEVIVYQDSRRDRGLIFPSLNPKIGDQIKLGPEDNNQKFTIKEISSLSLVEVTELSQTVEKARVKSDLGSIQIGLLNYKISAGSYPTTEQGLSALLTKPADVRAWEGPYFKEGPINDPWGNEYGYRFPSQKGQDKPDIFSKGADGQENTEDDIGNWEVEEDNPKVVVEEVKIKSPKLTPKQISDHLEFWTGKWKGYDKVTNKIFDSFEATWKQKGVSLEFKGITFEAGEQKDTYTGSIYYDKDLGVFVDTGTYEKSGQTLVRHAILDPESGESNGFAVKPKPPEGMEVKFKWKKLDRNTVDYFFEVVQGGDTLEEKEFVIKRQGFEPKEDSNQTKTSEFPDLIEEVDTEKIITLSVDGNEVTATRIIEGFPEFDFFYITSSGAFSIDELRIGKTHDSVTQESVPDDDENIIFHDSFEYSDGEKLIDQKNWYSEGLPRHISNSPDTYTISKGSLVSDGIKSVGNRVSTEATDAISGIGIELPDAASFDPDDNVFISFLIRPEGVIGDGVWGGYFSFGAKPFDGKGLLFGKPGNSSAPDDKKYAIDKQGGPLILTSGVETEVDKTSYVVIKIESPAIDKQAQLEAGNLLKKNIADKLITFGSEEREHGLQLQFNANGEMLMGADYDLSDRGSYTYKINGSEVMVYQGSKRDGGVLFPSVNPKVGDEVELGPENDKDKVTIKKIESVDNVVVAPEKQKDFAELENPKLTPKQLAEKISEKLKSKILEFKPIKGIADQAKRAEAMNEVNQLKIAISAYESEYAKLPFQARNAGEADLRMDTFKDNLISVLSGYNIDGLNPRKQPFYQGKRAKGRDSQKPTSGVFGADEKLKLADPWGNAYSIVFDSNNDLTLKGLPGTEGKEVRASVVIWSTGGADDQKKFDPEKWIKSW